MKTAIYYFSTTGNGIDISTQLGKYLDADVYSIKETSNIDNYDRIILVSPVYALGSTPPVDEFISTLKNDKEYYIVLHYGGFLGNAKNYFGELFKKQGLSVNNVYSVQMPVNFTIFITPPDSTINKILLNSKDTIKNIATSIQQNETSTIKKNIFSFFDSLHEKAVTAWRDMKFDISEECDACGYCESICPVNNISIIDNKPTFNNKCICCLACYHRCPKMAINYKDKTIGKKRYFNPNVDK